MSERELVDALLEAAFGTELPPAIGRVLDRERVAPLLDAFKLGPIFTLRARRRPRIALSNQGEASPWRARVLATFPHPELAAFLDRVPAAARRMLDTDGESAVVYLDDLQDVAGANLPDETPLMFLAFDARTGRVERGTRQLEPPRALVSGVLSSGLDLLLAHGAAGIWSLRLQGETPVGLIWVSECRWRDNSRVAASVVSALGAHPGLDACRRAAERAGYVAYPDAVEARLDGSWDVTLGFVRDGSRSG